MPTDASAQVHPRLLLSPDDYALQLHAAGVFVSSSIERAFPAAARAVVGIVLGSGLSDFTARLSSPLVLPYTSIPHMPRPAVSGHHGELVVGVLPPPCSPSSLVLCFSGRVHAYEGHVAGAVCFITRLCAALSVRALLLTNSAGGAGRGMEEGSVMLLTDHIRGCALNPARDCAADGRGRLGDGAVDAATSAFVYPAALQALARSAAEAQGLRLHEGVYHWSSGPTYETHAEVRAGIALGTSAFGMSTVPEVLAAAALRLPALALSLCTNLAAGLSAGEVLTHDAVKAVAQQAGPRFQALVHDLVARMLQHCEEEGGGGGGGAALRPSPIGPAVPTPATLGLDLHPRVGWWPSQAEVSAALELLSSANAGHSAPSCALVVCIGGSGAWRDGWTDVRAVPLGSFPALSSPPLSRSAATGVLLLATSSAASGSRRVLAITGMHPEGLTAAEAAWLAQVLSALGIRALLSVHAAVSCGAAVASSAPPVLLAVDVLDRTMESWPPLCAAHPPPAAARAAVFDPALEARLLAALPTARSGSVASFAGPSWPSTAERALAAAAGCEAVAAASPALSLYASALGLSVSAVFLVLDSAEEAAVVCSSAAQCAPLLSAIVAAALEAPASAAAVHQPTSPPPSPSRPPQPYGPEQEQWEAVQAAAAQLMVGLSSFSPRAPVLSVAAFLHPALLSQSPPSFSALWRAPASTLIPDGRLLQEHPGWTVELGTEHGPLALRGAAPASSSPALTHVAVSSQARVWRTWCWALRHTAECGRSGAAPTASQRWCPSCARSPRPVRRRRWRSSPPPRCAPTRRRSRPAPSAT